MNFWYLLKRVSLPSAFNPMQKYFNWTQFLCLKTKDITIRPNNFCDYWAITFPFKLVLSDFQILKFLWILKFFSLITEICLAVLQCRYRQNFLIVVVRSRHSLEHSNQSNRRTKEGADLWKKSFCTFISRKLLSLLSRCNFINMFETS